MHLIKHLMKTVKSNLIYILAVMVLVCISGFFSIGLATGECITITDDDKIFIDTKQYQDIYDYVEIEMFLNGDSR